MTGGLHSCRATQLDVVLLCAALVACGGGSEGGGGGPEPSGGAGGAGGSSGAGCVCTPDDAYEDKLCFCQDAGFGCSAEISIDRVLEPTCPGSLIHPFSVSCKIGGVLYPADFDLDELTEGFYFDRDTGELVGLYASTDAGQFCEGESVNLRWGNVAASCELCDPCGPNDEYPPCPEPEP